MANNYSQIFSLKDIFNNPALKNKLPLVNYKEKEREDGKISIRTNVRSIGRLVYETSVSSARPFYTDFKASKSGDRIMLGGNLQSDQDVVVNAVYNALLGKRLVMVYTANNIDIIRSALKEAEKNKNKYGFNSRLYLKAQSMQEIEGMTNREIQWLLKDIMDNILYGDDFPVTQKKFKVQEIDVGSVYNYEQRKLRWKQKVGG